MKQNTFLFVSQRNRYFRVSDLINKPFFCCRERHFSETMQCDEGWQNLPTGNSIMGRKTR
jgi:hypothetical protein